jgi:oligosaccharide repeat unit polymerase
VLKPNWVFLAYWLALLSSTMLLYPGARSKVTALGVLIILSAAAVFSLAAWVASVGVRAPDTTDRRYPNFSLSRVRALVILGSGANIVAALLALATHGFSLSSIASAEGLLATANSVSVARYEGQALNPLTHPLLGIGYASAIAAPLLRLAPSRGHWILVVSPLATTLVYSAVTTERLTLLLSASFMAGGFIASHTLVHGRAPRISRRSLAAVSAMAILAGSAFVGIGLLRLGRADGAVTQVLINKQRAYGLGSVPAFSQWLETTWRRSDDSPLWGTATIAGAEFLAAGDRRETRAYDEFTTIDDQGSQSNIYTVFRGLIVDFGLAGTYLVLALLGFVFGRLYRSARRGSIAATGGLASMYGILLLTNTMAVTTFTNVLAAIALACWVIASSRGRTASATGRRHRLGETRSALPLSAK